MSYLALDIGDGDGDGDGDGEFMVLVGPADMTRCVAAAR